MSLEKVREHLVLGLAGTLMIVLGYLISGLGVSSQLVIVAGFAGIFVATVVYFSPRVGFYTLLISSMFGGFNVSAILSGVGLPVPEVSLRPDQLVLLPVLSGVVLRLIATALGPRTLTGPRSLASSYLPFMVFVGFLMYIGANALSSLLFSPQTAESFRIVIWLLLSFLAFCITYSMIGRYVGVREALFAVLVAGFASAAIGIACFLLFQLTGSTFGIQQDPDPKVAGTFFEANIFGSFQTFTALVGLSVIGLGQVRRWTLGWILLGTVLSSIALALSFTRAAWLAFMIGILVIIFFQLRGGRSLILLSRVGVLVLIMLLVLAPTGLLGDLSTRLASITDLSNYTIAFRLQIFKAALAELSSSPILGLGTNSFGQRHFDPTNDFAPAYLPSLFLVTLYDVGIVGFLLLLGTFGIIVWALVQITLKDRYGWRGVFAIALLSGLVSLFVSYQGTNAFWFSYNWIIMAIALRLYQSDRQRDRTSRMFSSRPKTVRSLRPTNSSGDSRG